MKRISITVTVLLLAIACAASPCLAKTERGKNAAKDAAEPEAAPKDGDGKSIKPSRWTRLRPGTIDLTLQPAEVAAVGGVTNPSFELLYSKPRLGTLPLHVGLAYWGFEMDRTGSNSRGTYDNDYFDEETDRGASEVHRHYSLHAAVFRAKLFFSPGFFMNFGVGYRFVRTHEVADYDDGSRDSRFKEASSLGASWGVGNRFFIGQVYYIGANWIDLFVPFTVLSSKDAETGNSNPLGYKNESKTNDGQRASFRTLVLELGRIW